MTQAFSYRFLAAKVE